jgi:hypothetical protein
LRAGQNRQQHTIMSEDHPPILAHPLGEQPAVELLLDSPVPVDTYAGRIDVDWDPDAAVTPLGQLPFFIEYLKQAGLFDGWVAGCPIHYTSPNAPSKRDLLGTVFLSILSGHWRYAHITALRADPVSPPLLGMAKVLSEDAVRRGMRKIDPVEGEAWLQENLDYVTRPLLREPWILDVDTTVKPLFGHQEGAVVGYNPAKPGRPSHSYHSYLIANLRLVLDVEVHDGNQTASKHGAPGLWAMLDRLGRDCWPWLLRGDTGWGNEAVMREAEQRDLAYLFRIRMTVNVRRAIERATDGAWTEAGHGWEGQSTALRLDGWSRQRRVVLLRRKLEGTLAISEQDADGQQRLSFATVDARKQVWEYGALVTSTDAEILTLGQTYRDRADCENDFDEFKNQWGWAGFTTQDRHRCQLMARCVALVANWWNLYVRLADPDHHREAITSRPLLLTAIGRQTQHAGRTTLHVSSPHGRHVWARQALTRISKFFAELRQTAEQLTPLDRWYRILSLALVKYLHGRQLAPPRRIQAGEATAMG